MDKQRLTTLFQKLIDHQLTDAEKKEFLEHTKDPAARAVLEGLSVALWEESGDLIDLPENEEAERRIQKVINRVHPERRIVWVKWLGWAAACLTLFIFLPFWRNKPTPKKQPSTEYYEITTQYGQKKTLRMPDSSLVYLNSGSSIRYSSDFNKKNRSVKLKGEAYFEVKQDPSLPFVVESEGLITRVLGTTFNVKAFPDEEEVYVALKSGAVEVQQLDANAAGPTSRNRIILEPGRRVSFNKNKRELSVGQIGTMEAWGVWRKEVLSFNNMPFSEVKRLLERWYNVNIHVANQTLLHYRFTGSFEDLPINKVLSRLAKSSPFKYDIKEKEVYITGPGH